MIGMDVQEWVYGVWKSHCINLFNHDFDDDILVFDVDYGCHGFPLGPHESGAKDHAQITSLHQVTFRMSSNAE